MNTIDQYTKRKVDLMNRFPSIVDLQKLAHKRIPRIALAYMEGGTGTEKALQRNLDAFHDVTFLPQFLKGALNPNLSTAILGQKYNLPFGLAPIGMAGLMWPNAEIYFAQAASAYNIPFCLSTVASRTPEELSNHIGQVGWFQLYTPREKEHTLQLMQRAKAAGFQKLVVTVDIPTPSRRERSKRAGLSVPPKISPSFIWDLIRNPSWSLATLKYGKPSLKTIEDLQDFKDMMEVGQFMESQVGGNLDWDYLSFIKDKWAGPVIVKGIMHPQDAEEAVQRGMDAIWVSNHGGRQFDAVASSLSVLPEIKSLIGDRVPILFDSGVRTGLDVFKAISLGADFVFAGRAFLYAVAALGKIGVVHAIEILKAELHNNMMQMGVESIGGIKNLN